MARKRAFESIDEFLRSRYPSHPGLEGVESLAESGYQKLDELQKVNYRFLRQFFPPTLCIALRDYIKSDATDPVEDDCSMEWNFECTEVTVTLRSENQILELPSQFSPIIRCEPEVEIMDPEEENVQKLMDIKPETDEEGMNQVDEKELNSEAMALVENAYKDLPAPAVPASLLQVKMYKFSSERSRKAVRMLWCKTSGSCIIQRPSYLKLQANIENLWNAGVKAPLLLGVPGTGKTGFIICMLLWLMKRREAVVLQTKGGDIFLFEPQPMENPGIGVGYACLKLKNKSILFDSEVYFLVDDKMQGVPAFECKALLAATPKLLNFQDYDKDGRGTQLFLPVWSAAEIALAWQEIFDPSLPDLAHLLQGEPKKDKNDCNRMLEARKKLKLDVVRERYRKWGGTARFVLEKPHIDLDEVVSGLQSIQQTVEMLGKKVANEDHPSHKIVHQRVKEGYSSYEYMFGSPYLVEAARKKLKESPTGALRLFLSFKGLAAHGVNGCKGNIFEHEFKSLAQEVCKFKVRQVHEDASLDGAEEEEDVVFDFGLRFEVPKLEDLPAIPPVNRVVWPESKIEETIDALRVVRVAGQQDVLEVYQVTLSSKRHAHGLKYSAMLKVMQKFGIPPHRVKVYIVTTSELYPEAGYQNWRRSRNLVLRCRRILQQLIRIRQYVLDSGV